MLGDKLIMLLQGVVIVCSIYCIKLTSNSPVIVLYHVTVLCGYVVIT